jgi:hypothetical protein
MSVRFLQPNSDQGFRSEQRNPNTLKPQPSGMQRRTPYSRCAALAFREIPHNLGYRAANSVNLRVEEESHEPVYT